MNKRMKAQMSLEMIIGLLILLVVATVVIQLFLKNITGVDARKYTQSLKYKQFGSECENLCNDYLANKQRGTIAKFCKMKLTPATDLNNDGLDNSRLEAETMLIPMCEDAIYCFHIMNCESEGSKIGIEQCKSILCRAYYDVYKDWNDANEAVFDDIPNIGTCTLEPKDINWWEKWYGPAPCGGSAATTTITSATTTTTSVAGLSFSCAKSGDNGIKCDWSGCPETGDVVVTLSNDGGSYITSDKPSGTRTFTPLASGEYTATLACGDEVLTSSKITIG